jgi:fermentation-respiration switch protein FrsA (DUF1100 family)
MKLRILATLAAGVLSTTCLNAAENRVTIEAGGRGLAGILNIPDGASNPPVVLMLHGFTGQKNEFTIATTDVGLYTFTAEKLAEAGIASLRIDFHGSGESAGEWADTTFSGQIKDATIAFDYLQALPGLDGSKVGILGYSQGGLVGAHLAALRLEASAVVLWAPVTNPVATYSSIMGADTVKSAIQGDSSQETTTKLSWGGETTLKGAFFKELETVTPIGAISQYRGPLRVIIGEKETKSRRSPPRVESFSSTTTVSRIW